jgi:fibronectin type 3 domain-containing protein
VAGYNVYRGAQAAGPFTKISGTTVAGTTYTDSSVVAGTTYYYTVTTVSTSGTESSDSNVASATIPTP